MNPPIRKPPKAIALQNKRPRNAVSCQKQFAPYDKSPFLQIAPRSRFLPPSPKKIYSSGIDKFWFLFEGGGIGRSSLSSKTHINQDTYLTFVKKVFI